MFLPLTFDLEDNKQVSRGEEEEERGGADRRLQSACDRCELPLSASKLLRTEAENKHLGFRNDIPHNQYLTGSFSYIRGRDTAVSSLMPAACYRGTSSDKRQVTR